MQNRNRDFWSEVQRTKKCSSRMAGTVDGCSNPNTTANVFADKYEDLSVEPPGGGRGGSFPPMGGRPKIM